MQLDPRISDEVPHRRWNPLSERWVLVSPHRAKRPWQGQNETASDVVLPAYDPACYLCPGNVRANGVQTPNFKDVFVFDNDFAALLPNPLSGTAVAASGKTTDHSLLTAEIERGICKVICFSPRHDLTIPEMEVSAIRRVVDAWCHEYIELGKKSFIRYVQIFENKGAIQGCSNPHPHGQIWAQEHIPDEPLQKQKSQLKYFKQHGTTLLQNYLAEELTNPSERILFENEHFVTLVPYWAVWPFEAMIVPRRPMARITDMTDSEKDAFAAAYQRLTICYDNLFEVSFPYSAGIHQAPTDRKPHLEWHWHLAFYPPLLRSASVKKFMVGYEMLAGPQRDISPEKASSILRALPAKHYKNK